jgi:hypothetical protein
MMGCCWLEKLLVQTQVRVGVSYPAPKVHSQHKESFGELDGAQQAHSCLTFTQRLVEPNLRCTLPGSHVAKGIHSNAVGTGGVLRVAGGSGAINRSEFGPTSFQFRS